MSKPFIKLVRDACTTEQELRELSNDSRLTAEAIIKSCLIYGGTTLAKVAKLRASLQEDNQRLKATRSFVEQVYRGVIGGQYANGAPQNLARMAGMTARDEARIELTEIGFNLWDAWILGVENAKQRHPETFCSVKDPLSWQHKVDTLKAKRAELFKRISEEFGPADIEVSNIRDDGYALVTMTISPKVTLGPLSSLGERLVNHLLSIDPETWTTAATPKGRAAWTNREGVALTV